jgi:hypothetical protein
MSDGDKKDFMPGVDVIQRAESIQNGNISNVDLSEKTNVVIEDAAAYMQIHAHEWGSYSEKEANQVLRCIDLRLMPLFMVTWTFAGIDVSISDLKTRRWLCVAALFGHTASRRSFRK